MTPGGVEPPASALSGQRSPAELRCLALELVGMSNGPTGVVEPARVELASPVCETDVLPLNHGPGDGGVGGARTRGFLSARQALSLLSYDPVGGGCGGP